MLGQLNISEKYSNIGKCGYTLLQKEFFLDHKGHVFINEFWKDATTKSPFLPLGSSISITVNK